MKVTYEHKNELTFIGFHTEIAPDEGYKKCPEFWEEAYFLFKISRPSVILSRPTDRRGFL